MGLCQEDASSTQGSNNQVWFHRLPSFEPNPVIYFVVIWEMDMYELHPLTNNLHHCDQDSS